jgi:hypothetical protein
MNSIANFIINNITENTVEKLQYYHIQDDGYLDIEDICDMLFNIIDIYMVSELVIYLDNLRYQYATIISFKYDGRICNIGEYYDTQRNYFWVKNITY